MKRGQAAMEFLMTYGWAIVVVLAAIGALAYFGVLSPQKLLPSRTTFQAPIPNLDVAVISQAGNSVAIAFKNNKGVPITIPIGAANITTLIPATGTLFCNNSALSGIDAGTPLNNTAQIANGDTFILTWSCTGTSNAKVGDKFSADISFDYVNAETTQTLSQTGSVDGTWS